jgi:hypothetical protein
MFHHPPNNTTKAGLLGRPLLLYLYGYNDGAVGHIVTPCASFASNLRKVYYKSNKNAIFDNSLCDF